MIPRNFLVSILERYHIIIELPVPESLVAPEQVCPPVVIYKHSRVDKSETSSERSSDRIFPWSLRTVRYRNCKSVAAALCRTAQIPVPLSVTLHRLRSPCLISLGSPVKRSRGHLRSEIGPVHHILGAEDQPVLHKEIGGVILIMVGKKIEFVPVHIRRRIRSIDGADYRILSRDGRRNAGHSQHGS